MPGGRPRKPVPPTDPAIIWSTWIQPVEILDLTRGERFRDEVKDVLWPVLGLQRGGVAVDVGCGSGALTRVLARWMGSGSTVYGVDRDKNFVAYATERAKQAGLGRRTRYLQGDALALPLSDGIADAVTSYTVISHIPDHRAFLREQKRLCKPGGRVSVMEVWSPTGGAAASLWAVEQTEREKELWKPLEAPGKARVDEPWQVGKFTVGGLYDYAVLLEQAGLEEIMVDAFSTIYALDDARTAPEQADRRLEAEMKMCLRNVDNLSRLVSPRLPVEHLSELKRLIHMRFNKRRRYLRAGRRIWDWAIGTSLVASGKVPER